MFRAHDLYQNTYLYPITTLRDRRCCEIYTSQNLLPASVERHEVCHLGLALSHRMPA